MRMRGTYKYGYPCLNSKIDVVGLVHVTSFLQEGSQMLAAANRGMSFHGAYVGISNARGRASGLK